MKLVLVVVILVDGVEVSLRRLLGVRRQNLYLWWLVNVCGGGCRDENHTLDHLALRDAALRIVNDMLLDDLSLLAGILLLLHARVVMVRLLRQILLRIEVVYLTILLVVERLLLLPAVVEHASQKDTDKGSDQKAENQGDDGTCVDEVNALVKVVDVLWVETVILETFSPPLIINLRNIHERDHEDDDRKDDGVYNRHCEPNIVVYLAERDVILLVNGECKQESHAKFDAETGPIFLNSVANGTDGDHRGEDGSGCSQAASTAARIIFLVYAHEQLI